MNNGVECAQKICSFVLLSEKKKTSTDITGKRMQKKRLWDWKIISNFE